MVRERRLWGLASARGLRRWMIPLLTVSVALGAPGAASAASRRFTV